MTKGRSYKELFFILIVIVTVGEYFTSNNNNCTEIEKHVRVGYECLHKLLLLYLNKDTNNNSNKTLARLYYI